MSAGDEIREALRRSEAGLANRLRQLGELVKHGGTLGTAREDVVADYIQATLPQRIETERGQIRENQTLARDLTVSGTAREEPLPAPASSAVTDTGYRVQLDAEQSRAGQPAELSFHVTRGGEDVAVEDYLGANGHLVALRAGDLAYLHTHPAGDDGHGDAIRFETEFPTEARYRLFLQFKDSGEVHTAALTREVAR